MKFTQKLRKFGNSVGIIIPSKILQDLNIHVGSQVFIEKVQDKLLIEKELHTGISPDFFRVADALANRYEDVFKELSDK